MPSRPSLSLALGRGAGWLRRWAPVLPLLVAEFILWTGFGALLPVMPLYFTEHGVDVAFLGVVIAAWPAARLFTEPLFGRLADRTARVPLMVIGLVVAATSIGAMAVWTAPAAFIGLRALSGLGTALYDPAARGYLADAAPPERRGEAFGLYNAAQMGGILLGPAIGGLGTALVGGYAFVLVLGAVTTAAAAISVALRVPELHVRHQPSIPASSLVEFPGDPGGDLGHEVASRRPGPDARVAPAPASLRNRFITTAILVNVGNYFGGGLYETIWALFVTNHGGSVALIGLTFATFGLVTILLSPFAGRAVDRRGPLPFVILGLLVTAGTMALYPLVAEPLVYVPLVALDAVGFAFLGPATYMVIARGTPVGRSSSAQGLAGAAGTFGTIVASLATGVLAARSLDVPFFVGSAVVFSMLLITLVVGGRALRSMRPAAPA